MILDKIDNPKDLKPLSLGELEQLAAEMRSVLMEKLSVTGGHLGPNLGIIEATIALHYVFDSPRDKLVFDVSHQCYPHKMLTGRKDAYLDPEKYDTVTGFTNPDESEHDIFKVGHTATSISLACGLAKSRDLLGHKENVIAIIGDGALSGGEAYEGLNYASEQGTNLIVVVNDNGMAIAENHGGLYPHLKKLRDSKGKESCNFFKALGFEYHYVEKGNNIESLIHEFRVIKDVDHPVVVHIHTVKGKGYEIAENAAENWHYRPPFFIDNGEMRNANATKRIGYDELTRDYFLNKMKEDPAFALLVAAVPGSVRFYKEERQEAGTQFIDVGIAEEHAISMAAGMAKNGGKPVFVTDCTFFQRTYDQIAQEMCINNASATLLVRNASIWGLTDITHLGLFDIPMMSNIPNLVYLAPTNQEEYFAMLEWSIEQDRYPVAIRMPKSPLSHADYVVDTDYSQLNRAFVCRNGSKVSIIAMGDFYSIGEQTADLLSEEGINATLINPRYITGIDTDLLEELKINHNIVITLEDGILDGGYGQKIASYYGNSDMKVLNFGFKKEFIDRYNAQEELEKNNLTPRKIVQVIKSCFS